MNTTNLHLKPPPPPLHHTNNNLLLFQMNTLNYKRWRIKLTRRKNNNKNKNKLTLCNCISNNLLDPFQNFLSQFPSPNSLDFLAPALGLASGLTLYLSQLNSNKNNNNKQISKNSDIGEWILFTSPTTFNHFVILRCPSISFEGNEFFEDVDHKLIEEDRHFVRLNSGRIIHHGGENGKLEEKLVYQRVCISTDDGGVVSLDWPANLDLKEEHGLDTTFLLVPGNAEGSMDENVRMFVCEAVRQGFFPVVMNPRGCAGSPIITARLFTAADSDDISTAIQFISKARSWTTLMGVGWGYGANMLTKYLAEVGERTPLTAATCINNPFDLEEATRCSPYNIALNQKLTGGLIDILQSNKELFQGRANRFDVEKALLAKSVRDFEKAISMVSYGFEQLEDFYSKSSTRHLVGNVKIPVLFIQNDDGTVPLFSIPRSVIAENPFTSLLLCSCVSSREIASDRAAVSWCQNLTIEWLTAVELGLLKGRHPLLKDVDVTINPSKGLSLVEGRSFDKVITNKLLTDTNGYAIDPIKDMLVDGNTAFRLHSRFQQDSHGNLELKEGLQEVENGLLQQISSVDAEFVKEEAADHVDAERSQVLQTAQMVMNMLDVTMPGTLTEDEKGKVLTAVGQGETLLKALQDAVPEDVRERLTTAVSGILHAQDTNLKFKELLGIGKIPNVPSGLKPKTHDRVRSVSSIESMPEDPHSSDQTKRVDDVVDGSDNNLPGLDSPGVGEELKLHPSENLQKPVDLGQSQTMNSQQGDTSGSVYKGANELGNSYESDELIKAKATMCSERSEKGLETNVKHNFASCTERAGGAEEAVIDSYKVGPDVGIPQPGTKAESNTQKNEEKTLDSSTEQNKMASTNMTQEALLPAGSSPDSQPMEREGNDNHTRENKTVQPVLDQNKPSVSDSNPPSFSVVQALDALTGMDDSTQVAVNSVFGVIESMISQLEEEKDDNNEVKNASEVEDKSIDSTLKKQPTTAEPLLTMKENGKGSFGRLSDIIQDPVVYKHHENSVNPQNASSTGWMEEESSENPIVFSGNGTDGSQGNTASNHKSKVEKKMDQLVGSKVFTDYTDKHISNFPLHITANLYGDYLCNEYLCRYLRSKMPNTEPLDLDTTTALLLDYFPEEGQWKLLEQPGNIGDVTTHNVVNKKGQVHLPAEVTDTDSYIEPSYVVLDTEKQHDPVGEYGTTDNCTENVEDDDDRLEALMQFVKTIVLDALGVEVGRKLSAADMKEMKSSLGKDLQQVATAVSLAIGYDKDHTCCLHGKDSNLDHTPEKIGTVHGENIIRAISSTVRDTSYLRRVLPIGIIIGSTLAALRKYFNVTTGHDNGLSSLDQTQKSGEKIQVKACTTETEEKPANKTNRTTSLYSTRSGEREEAGLKNINNDSVMVGAVTAALGASALLVQQQDPYKGKGAAESASKSFEERGNYQKVDGKLDEAMPEKNQNNIVTSLAEKAMSVAGPVVPTNEDGEVDQERLVAMLADLGQKGGMLRLVGKIALLWAGIRGAMSLTDRLILFLRIAERPLYQRILGFVGMVLVLWSPVIVPLLPTLVQSWTTSNPSRFAELVCIIGLYTAVMILVMLWGKRIRGYEDPLEQYGLGLKTRPKIQNFWKGLIGGVLLVLSIQSVNALLGCMSFSWPSSLTSSSLDAISYLKVCGQIITLAARGTITATGVVLVEELLFRSWLPEEIAADLGYNRGIIISGFAFSLFQRSPWAIPGLWLFSLALAGLRQRNQGNLSIPVGFRSGIMASSSVLQAGGFLTYKHKFPLWVTGTNPFEPFSGVVGLALSLLLAMIFYPKQTLQKKKKLKRTIKE